MAEAAFEVLPLHQLQSCCSLRCPLAHADIRMYFNFMTSLGVSERRGLAAAYKHICGSYERYVMGASSYTIPALCTHHINGTPLINIKKIYGLSIFIWLIITERGGSL